MTPRCAAHDVDMEMVTLFTSSSYTCEKCDHENVSSALEFDRVVLDKKGGNGEPAHRATADVLDSINQARVRYSMEPLKELLAAKA
jgi:hypothetical protein